MSKTIQTGNIKDILENIIPISEAPEKISIAEKTLRNWRSQGIYPQLFIKLGGKVFVDLSELAKIVTLQKEEAVEKMKRLGLEY
ncbi:putative DNA binding domain-containing protein [Desulfonema limicola]|uniref:DNA binding domain-containing protein n=1 Tax=Desulfonema limicola TaxID=45656 RepID=A0A975GET2_9BACT|nr:hypothetical protein [Desulfonema limicola]QTA78523.1 putative DNA binding domain-containing protein [Desulfonema limicola]